MSRNKPFTRSKYTALRSDEQVQALSKALYDAKERISALEAELEAAGQAYDKGLEDGKHIALTGCSRAAMNRELLRRGDYKV